MPWQVKKIGEKWHVIRESDGKDEGESSSKEKAEAHRRALYANAPEARRQRGADTVHGAIDEIFRRKGAAA